MYTVTLTELCPLVGYRSHRCHDSSCMTLLHSLDSLHDAMKYVIMHEYTEELHDDDGFCIETIHDLEQEIGLEKFKHFKKEEAKDGPVIYCDTTNSDYDYDWDDIDNMIDRFKEKVDSLTFKELCGRFKFVQEQKWQPKNCESGLKNAYYEYRHYKIYVNTQLVGVYDPELGEII